MGPAIRKAVQQNQIFTVVSVDPADPRDRQSPDPLFTFGNRYLEISDWTFDLSPAGLPRRTRQGADAARRRSS